MSEVLYEQYKDALRRGHVAALRGRLDVAAAAYREATRIAPDRALPYVGLGGVLTRLGKADDALGAYATALEHSPTDEGAMQGSADVLAALGRATEAAETLDRLAVILEQDDRLADACDVARSALELAGSPARRRQVEELVERLRATASGDTFAADALRRALGVLEGGSKPDAEAAADAEDAATEAGPRPLPPRPTTPDPALLTLAVEEALEAGDLDAARRHALVAANGHRAVGQFHAAMDACYQALAILPSDPDIHLLLAELYLDRGWRGPAADKLVLLGRLSQLTGDDATRARLCYLAAARFPDDSRLAAVCA
ncbi:MAG TPA: tetratricopeptide repeat protein [Candidatus Limnocylindrales bacterium]|nr:tetratricopeptide repeat protein [Candidatus Limnocylindrales bacterium]